jgi:predicted ATPase
LKVKLKQAQIRRLFSTASVGEGKNLGCHKELTLLGCVKAVRVWVFCKGSELATPGTIAGKATAMPLAEEKTIKQESRQEEKTYLSVNITNFGPIRSGKIALKPLTVFIGPNNSGKSYAALLIRAVFGAKGPGLEAAAITMRSILRGEVLETQSGSAPWFAQLKQKIDSLAPGGKLEVTEFFRGAPDYLELIVLEMGLGLALARTMSAPVSELPSIGKRFFEIELAYGDHSYRLESSKKSGLSVKEHSRPEVRIFIEAVVVSSHEGKVLRITFLEPSGTDQRKESISVAYQDITLEAFDELGSAIAAYYYRRFVEFLCVPCHYLPAARSGILHAHRALAASVLKSSTLAGTEAIQVPRFSGAVADFVSQLLELPEKAGPFHDIAQQFEERLVQGHITTRYAEKFAYPEFRYSFLDGKGEIPLYRSSSTVSELAPLFLFLKYLVKEKDLLIIEEPEAHLHPDNQRLLAQLLVRLIRNGLRILITTHSDYLLEQINHFIALSKVPVAERKKKFSYGEEDFLNPDEVGAYVFGYDQKSKGYKITELEIDEEGISEEEFVRVDEALYEEIIKIRESTAKTGRRKAKQC